MNNNESGVKLTLCTYMYKRNSGSKILQITEVSAVQRRRTVPKEAAAEEEAIKNVATYTPSRHNLHAICALWDHACYLLGIVQTLYNHDHDNLYMWVD